MCPIKSSLPTIPHFDSQVVKVSGRVRSSGKKGTRRLSDWYVVVFLHVFISHTSFWDFCDFVCGIPSPVYSRISTQPRPPLRLESSKDLLLVDTHPRKSKSVEERLILNLWSGFGQSVTSGERPSTLVVKTNSTSTGKVTIVPREASPFLDDTMTWSGLRV